MTLRTWFVLALAGSVLSTMAALASIFGGPLSAPRLMNSAAVLWGLSSVLQLRVSGWFDFALETFGDEENFPHGPPSSFTRDYFTIDNPDEPVRSSIRTFLFTNSETGFKLGIVSLIVALVAAWI